MLMLVFRGTALPNMNQILCMKCVCVCFYFVYSSDCGVVHDVEEKGKTGDNQAIDRVADDNV